MASSSYVFLVVLLVGMFAMSRVEFKSRYDPDTFCSGRIKAVNVLCLAGVVKICYSVI